MAPPFFKTPGGASPLLVPPMFKGATITILGDGPSLNKEDVDFVRGKSVVLAINYTLQLAPWADVFYYYHEEVLEEMVGEVDLLKKWEEGMLVFSSNPSSLKLHPWPYVPFSGATGLEKDARRGLRHGSNSGHAAINLAFQLGAAKIILLGYDCGPAESGAWHWKKGKDHPTRSTYDFLDWRRKYQLLAEELRSEVEVVNASRSTTLEMFPRRELREALS